MIIIGKLGDTDKLAGVGIGNATITIFGVAVFVGLNGALGTLASQSVGDKQFELSGVLLWRSRLIMGCSFLMISPIFLFS